MSDEPKKPAADEEHDHDHDHGEEVDWTPALVAARSGLKSRVEELIDALAEAQVYIPLSEDLPDTPENEQIEMDGDLTFRPHMILNAEHEIFAVAYSDPEYVAPMQEALDWQTSGSDLKFICVPAHVAFDLAQTNIEGDQVGGVVINPGTDAELVLQRDEAASLAQGVPIPLVGYVADLPPGAEEETQIVEGAAPPPAELLEALERAKKKIKNLLDTEVQTTFNPERDREPHLTITLTVIASDNQMRQAIADDAMEEAAPHVPPPGYADIVFRDAPN